MPIINYLDLCIYNLNIILKLSLYTFKYIINKKLIKSFSFK